MFDLWSAPQFQVSRLFRRCVVCPEGPQNLACPACKDNEVCTQKSVTCDECVVLICLPIEQSGSTNASVNPSSQKPNVGAIAGGVAGGVVLLCVSLYLLWKFWLKARWTSNRHKEGKIDDFTFQRNARASTNTTASFASTVVTRASNFIPIGFVTGFNFRSSGVPPVPPLPGGGDRYFINGLDRGSTFSAADDNRDSINTIGYGDSAVVTPMATAIRGRAAVVSVKPSAAPSSSSTPNATSPTAARPPQSSKLGQYVTNANISTAASPLSSPDSFDKVYELPSSSLIELPGSSPSGQREEDTVPSAFLQTSSNTTSRAPSPLSLHGGNTGISSHQASTAHSLSPPGRTQLESQSGFITGVHSDLSTVMNTSLASAQNGSQRQGNGSPFSDDNRIN